MAHIRRRVVPEEINRRRVAHAQNAWEFKRQVFNVAPSVLLGRLSPGSGFKIRKRGKTWARQRPHAESAAAFPNAKRRSPNRCDNCSDIMGRTVAKVALVYVDMATVCQRRQQPHSRSGGHVHSHPQDRHAEQTMMPP